MNWWLLDLVKRFREDGCPPPAEPDWEPPCRLCRAADAVLAEKWSPLDWVADGGLVAEVGGGTYAHIDRAGDKWAWKVTQEQGWELVTLHEGTATSLVDALQAAEKAVKGVE